jgi:hypothetical protein
VGPRFRNAGRARLADGAHCRRLPCRAASRDHEARPAPSRASAFFKHLDGKLPILNASVSHGRFAAVVGNARQLPRCASVWMDRKRSQHARRKASFAPGPEPQQQIRRWPSEDHEDRHSVRSPPSPMLRRLELCDPFLVVQEQQNSKLPHDDIEPDDQPAHCPTPNRNSVIAPITTSPDPEFLFGMRFQEG